MARIARIAGAAVLALGLWGCKSDLDVTAPYKNITIVYALLNAYNTDGVPQNDTQYVKINRAFLGEGNAFTYAQIPDSTEFTDAELVNAEVQRLNEQGQVVAHHALHSIQIADRDVGIFPTNHRLYYFVAQLDPTATYQLSATAKGTPLKAVTPLVNNFNPNPTLLSPLVKLGFATGGSYSDYTVRWDSGVNGKRYELSYRFNYDEISGADTIHKSFTQFVATTVAGTINGGEHMQSVIAGEDFYRSIASEVAAQSSPSVSKRLFRGIDLIWAVAAQDLHVYLQLANPISGIVEERPQYSNVENGYGLFTSRFFREVKGKQLNDGSTTELVDGQFTAGLNFCVPGGTGAASCD